MADRQDMEVRDVAVRRAARQLEGPKKAIIEIYSDLETAGSMRRASTLRRIAGLIEDWQHKYRA